MLAARYPSRWAMRPHLLCVQMHRVCKEQRGQAEGTTYFEISCFRLPGCMHARALCAVADSFASTQHHQPPVEHWRYAPLDLACFTLLRSARCRYDTAHPPPTPLTSFTRTSVYCVRDIQRLGCRSTGATSTVFAGVLLVPVDQAVGNRSGHHTQDARRLGLFQGVQGDRGGSTAVTLAGLSPESHEVPQPGAVERLLQNSGRKRSSSQRRFGVRGVRRPERIRRLHSFRALLAHRMGRESAGPVRCETG